MFDCSRYGPVVVDILCILYSAFDPFTGKNLMMKGRDADNLPQPGIYEFNGSLYKSVLC